MANKLKIGITAGDVNGIGYEVILKAFEDEGMLEFCTPVVYGSPKVATYHRKAIGSETNFCIADSAQSAQPDRLNIVNCNADEVKVELGTVSEESGRAALQALQRAVEEYRNGYIDAIVTAPVCKSAIHSDAFAFPGQTEFFEHELGEGRKALMILMNDSMRVALATVHEPVAKVASLLSKDMIKEKIAALNDSLKRDFRIEIPEIAVLALNPHAGDNGLLGAEENEIISPAIQEMSAEGIKCFGPFPADGFFGSGDHKKFDAILAMYHDQGLIPLKLCAMDEGVNFTAGLPVVRTSPDHGTAFDIAGQGIASEQSFRQAVYAAIDIVRARRNEDYIHRNPLRKQYFDRRDDSDKLRFDTPDEG